MKFNRIAALEFNYSQDFYEKLQELSIIPPILHLPGSEGLQSVPDSEGIDCIVASWRDTLEAASLKLFPSLKALFIRGTDTTRIDCSWLSERGIHLSTISSYGDSGTAEFVIHEFLRSAIGNPRIEIAGKRVGLVGLGGVGLLVAKACHAIGMEVFYYTPHRGKTRPGFAQYLELPELLKTCKFISFHSPAYTHAVTRQQLHLISSDAVVIVTTLGIPTDMDGFTTWKRQSRALVVCDLCAAQQDGPLLEDAGVHVRNVYAARTAESIERAETMLLSNIRDFVEGEPVSHSIHQAHSPDFQAASLS